jgi:hypothetical protein
MTLFEIAMFALTTVVLPGAVVWLAYRAGRREGYRAAIRPFVSDLYGGTGGAMFGGTGGGAMFGGSGSAGGGEGLKYPVDMSKVRPLGVNGVDGGSNGRPLE